MSLYRQLHRDGSALVRTFLHPNGATVEIGDLPHQRKPQPCAAVLSAAGFIHPEKGMENAALKFRLNAAAGIAYANENLGFRLRCYCLHRAAGAVLKPSGGNCAVLPLL